MPADTQPQSKQQQWAKALKKQRRESQQKTTRDIATQKKELAEAIAFHKQKVIEAIDTDQEVMLEKHVRSLVKLRADQIAVAMQESQELFGDIEPTFVEQYIKQYNKDLIRLTMAIKALTS